jgi:antitoxin VapB
MSEPRATAKLFMHGRSQAVRLPKEFRMPGTEVRIRREGDAVILEPIRAGSIDLKSWFRRLDEAYGPDFMAEGRDQPPLQERKHWYEE